MSFSIGPFRISKASQGATEKASAPEYDANALRRLNAPALDYVRSMPVSEMETRLSRVIHPALETETDFKIARDILERTGIVVIPDFLDIDFVDEVRAHTDALLGELDANILDGPGFETDAMLVQTRNPTKVTGYSAMADYPKPVVSVRQGQDQGMIDIFNVDALMPDLRERLRAAFQRPWLLKLLEGNGSELSAQNLNLYANRGITSTRGFHVDSYRRTLKGFVYLVDVPDLDNGPYCYVEESHRDDIWRSANRRISEAAPSKTETPFVETARVMPVVGRRGTFVLSDQAGMHRGIPQVEHGARQVLVMRYK